MTYQLRNVRDRGRARLARRSAHDCVRHELQKRNVQHGQQDVGVLVAATNIPAGKRSGAANRVRTHARAEDDSADCARSGRDFRAPTRSPVSSRHRMSWSGEQVTKVALRRRETSLASAQSSRGTLRAIQVAADPNQILAGTLRTGDHVDVRRQPEGGDVDRQQQHCALRPASSCATCSCCALPAPADIKQADPQLDPALQRLCSPSRTRRRRSCCSSSRTPIRMPHLTAGWALQLRPRHERGRTARRTSRASRPSCSTG